MVLFYWVCFFCIFNGTFTKLRAVHIDRLKTIDSIMNATEAPIESYVDHQKTIILSVWSTVEQTLFHADIDVYTLSDVFLWVFLFSFCIHKSNLILRRSCVTNKCQTTAPLAAYQKVGVFCLDLIHPLNPGHTGAHKSRVRHLRSFAKLHPQVGDNEFTTSIPKSIWNNISTHHCVILRGLSKL